MLSHTGLIGLNDATIRILFKAKAKIPTDEVVRQSAGQLLLWWQPKAATSVIAS